MDNGNWKDPSVTPTFLLRAGAPNVSKFGARWQSPYLKSGEGALLIIDGSRGALTGAFIRQSLGLGTGEFRKYGSVQFLIVRDVSRSDADAPGKRSGRSAGLSRY